MGKKKYHFFDTGDLIKFKMSHEAFQRGANGIRQVKSETRIKVGQKAIFLGAKVCPSSSKTFQPNPDLSKPNDYVRVRLITVKIMWEGSVWHLAMVREAVFEYMKLVQKVHK